MWDRLLQDPIFFYAVAYVIFLALAFKFGRKPALEWIDGEIAKISRDLEEAKKLRAEAEALLADAKAKKTAALADADAILKHAQEESVRLQAEEEEKAKFVRVKHEQHALERIRLMEEEAVASIRGAVVEQAMQAVRETLAQRIDEANASRLADQAIAEMLRLKVDNAEAA